MGKYEAKTRPTDVGVSDFLDSIEDEKQRDWAWTIDSMMRRVSGEKPKMWGPSIVGYGEYHYRYDSGHEGDAPRIGFSPRKAELVLYILPTAPQEQPETDALLAKLGPHRTGKSCLYLRNLDKVDPSVLERLAEFSWASMARRYPD